MPRARRTTRPRVFGALLGLYLLGVLLVLAWPTPVDRGYSGLIRRVLDFAHGLGLPGWFGYAALEFTANILLFIPLGLLLTLILPTHRWWVALITWPAFSIAAELFQGVAREERFASLQDVVANSLGSSIGVVLAMLIFLAVPVRPLDRD